MSLRLVVGASSGGHVNELLVLLKAAKGLWPVEPFAYVTTMEISAKAFTDQGKPVIVLGEADRTKWLGIVKVGASAWHAARQLRPEVVVTTGSAPLALFCFFSYLRGARVVWIDSVAQVDRMSLSGRLIKPFASLCLVQWPNLVATHRATEYVGELY